MGDDEANMETIERAFNGCATCGHPYASHTRTDGGCGVMMVPTYRCSCTQYAAPVAVPDGLTDLPDAVVQAAAEAMKRIVPNTDGVLWEFENTDPNTGEPVQPRPVTLHDAARAALAAASGPWAEQLDAALERERAVARDVVTERDRLAVHEAKLEAEVTELRAAMQTLWKTVGERDTELSALGGYGADVTLAVGRLLKQRDAALARNAECPNCGAKP